MTIMNFLDSNFFTGLITLLVGFSAIILYFRQKNDQKRDAAKLILQEIRYAEQTIRIAKEHGYNYYLANKLLPTNSWHKNINFFVHELKETDIDLISRFYSHSSYIDILIMKISDKKNEMLFIKKKPTGVSLPTPSLPIIPTSVPFSPIDPNVNTIISQEFELNSTNILRDVSEKVEFIYNTPAIDKLRLISEKKYLWFI